MNRKYSKWSTSVGVYVQKKQSKSKCKRVVVVSARSSMLKNKNNNNTKKIWLNKKYNLKTP